MNRYIATPQVRTLIRDQGRTFRWVAASVNMSDSHFNRILSGERWITRDNAEHIASILGTPFFDLWKVADATHEVEAA